MGPAAPLRVLASVVLALGALPAPDAQDPAPSFEGLEPGALRAVIDDVERVTKRSDVGCVVWIEVENRGQRHAEPLAFRIEPRGGDAEPIEVRRVGAPHFGRAGRTIAPGNSLRYPLLVHAGEKALARASVEVTAASTVDRPPELPAPPARVGRPRTENEFDRTYGQTLDRTLVPLVNETTSVVDVVLELELRGSVKGTTLVAARLEPGEERELVVTQVPLGGGSYFPGVDARRVELVDWSVVVDDGAERARELLRETWNAWRQVPADRLPLSARFTFDRAADGARSSTSGVLVVGTDGAVDARFDGEPSAELREGLDRLTDELRWHLVRPSLDRLLGSGEPTLQSLGEETRITLPRAPFTGWDGERTLEIRGGRIVLDTGDPLGDGLPARWHVADRGDGWRVEGKSIQVVTPPPEAEVELRIGWAEDGGLALPAVVTREDLGVLLGEPETLVLSLDGWRPGASAPRTDAPSPSGPLADRLREAWDAGYRRSRSDVAVRGRFRARNSGVDDVWLGRREVEGTFRVAGATPTFWREVEIEVEGHLSDAERAGLAAAVRDRFLMWSCRDFARRAPFDRAFAGAVLAEDGDRIRVENGPVESVVLADGHVAALRTLGGAEVELVWDEFGGREVVVERRSGGERVETDWEELDDGVLFPEEWVFEDVFTTDDYDWGTERVRLSRLELEDS